MTSPSWAGTSSSASRTASGPRARPARPETRTALSSSSPVAGEWDVVGKCDGLTADPALGRLVATVNEDAHSSFYLIDPVAGSTPVHYHYNKALPSRGGTDAITVNHGMLLFSASAPGTTG